MPVASTHFLACDDELVAVGRTHVQCQSVALARNLLHANALREASAVLVELDDQAVQQRHGIELSLVGKTDAAVEGKRHVGIVDPVHRQPGGFARLEFGSCRRNALLGLRIGEGVFALHRKAVCLAVPDQPLLALAVAFDVLLSAFRPVLGNDFRQLACPAAG